MALSCCELWISQGGLTVLWSQMEQGCWQFCLLPGPDHVDHTVSMGWALPCKGESKGLVSREGQPGREGGCVDTMGGTHTGSGAV